MIRVFRHRVSLGRLGCSDAKTAEKGKSNTAKKTIHRASTRYCCIRKDFDPTGSVRVSTDMLEISERDDEQKGHNTERRQHIKDRDLLEVNEDSNNDRRNDKIQECGRTAAEISKNCHVQNSGDTRTFN